MRKEDSTKVIVVPRSDHSTLWVRVRHSNAARGFRGQCSLKYLNIWRWIRTDPPLPFLVRQRNYSAIAVSSKRNGSVKTVLEVSYLYHRTLISLLEHKAHKELHQRESHFDQQITEYQDKLEQAHLKTEHIQAELVKLHEEKTKSAHTLNSLQQELTTLRSQLDDQSLIIFLYSICLSYS